MICATTKIIGKFVHRNRVHFLQRSNGTDKILDASLLGLRNLDHEVLSLFGTPSMGIMQRSIFAPEDIKRSSQRQLAIGTI